MSNEPVFEKRDAYTYSPENLKGIWEQDPDETNLKIAWQLDISDTRTRWLKALGWVYEPDYAKDDKTGKVFISGGKWVVINEKTAIIKKREGFEVIKLFIENSLNKDIVTGTMKKEQIEKHVLADIRNLTNILAFNMDEYGISDLSSVELIKNGARKMLLFHLSKSEDGFIMRAINEIRRVLYSGDTQPKKKGITDYIPFIGGK
jgi:hypothetical protein